MKPTPEQLERYLVACRTRELFGDTLDIFGLEDSKKDYFYYRIKEKISDTFTSEELEQIIVFYNSPVGQKCFANFLELSAWTGKVLEEILGDIVADKVAEDKN